jgi:hypothetical protein
VAALGRPWGLLAHSEKTGRLSTLAEVAAWLESASTVPIVFLIWSPRCPYVKAYDSRIQSIVGRAGARLYAVSSNARITADEVRGFVREHRTPYRVLVDPRQEVCDLLGGRNTPEAIVVDAKNVLRYRGGIDDDPLEDKKLEERAQWLCDAVTALVEGRDVPSPRSPRRPPRPPTASATPSPTSRRRTSTGPSGGSRPLAR